MLGAIPVRHAEGSMSGTVASQVFQQALRSPSFEAKSHLSRLCSLG